VRIAFSTSPTGGLAEYENRDNLKRRRRQTEATCDIILLRFEGDGSSWGVLKVT
jgi:hypothetical protein